jgi:hypothetical protein
MNFSMVPELIMIHSLTAQQWHDHHRMDDTLAENFHHFQSIAAFQQMPKDRIKNLMEKYKPN